jgi:hypothetical protein
LEAKDNVERIAGKTQKKIGQVEKAVEYREPVLFRTIVGA